MCKTTSCRVLFVTAAYMMLAKPNAASLAVFAERMGCRLEAVSATAWEKPARTNRWLRKLGLEKYQIHNNITGAPRSSPSSQWTFPTIATNTFSFVQAGLTWVSCYSENSRARTSWVITDEWRNVGKEESKGVWGSSLVVQWLRFHLPMHGVCVRFLVRELRSHMPHSPKKKEKRKEM